MNVEQRQKMLSAMRAQHHRNCPVCGEQSIDGLHIVFDACSDGSVAAEIVLGRNKEGYDGHIHGGIIASLLDGAMTNCLFSHGVQAVTAELGVRMLHPVEAGKTITVHGQLERHMKSLYILNAAVEQDGRIAAKGNAKFIRKTTTKEPLSS